MSFPPLVINGLSARVPIIQGGMGVGVSLSRLSSAVANAGGIGVISSAMIGIREADIFKDTVTANLRALRSEIAKAKEMASQGIIGVNIMVALSSFSEMVRTSIEAKADIIFAGAGLPLDLPRHLLDLCEQKQEEFKTRLVPIVSSARAAGIIAKKWMSRFGYLPDAFVVEGPEAGGHLGFKPEDLGSQDHNLDKLTSEVIQVAIALEDQVGKSVPVIAAGGVYNGADIRRLLSRGAAGVQMGTRFVATYECDASDKFKQAYIDARETEVTIIKSPVGMPGRALRNNFIDAVEKGLTKPFKCLFNCISSCQRENAPYCIATALINAMNGNLEKGFAFCGSNAFRVKDIVSVNELISSLEREYDAA